MSIVCDLELLVLVASLAVPLVDGLAKVKDKHVIAVQTLLGEGHLSHTHAYSYLSAACSLT